MKYELIHRIHFQGGYMEVFLADKLEKIMKDLQNFDIRTIQSIAGELSVKYATSINVSYFNTEREIAFSIRNKSDFLIMKILD